MSAEKALAVIALVRDLSFVNKVFVSGANKLKDVAFDEKVLFYYDTGLLNGDYKVTAEIDGETLYSFVAGD